MHNLGDNCSELAQQQEKVHQVKHQNLQHKDCFNSHVLDLAAVNQIPIDLIPTWDQLSSVKALTLKNRYGDDHPPMIRSRAANSKLHVWKLSWSPWPEIKLAFGICDILSLPHGWYFFLAILSHRYAHMPCMTIHVSIQLQRQWSHTVHADHSIAHNTQLFLYHFNVSTGNW